MYPEILSHEESYERLRQENAALLKLVEVYREYNEYPYEHNGHRTYTNKLDNCSICEEEQAYEQETKK